MSVDSTRRARRGGGAATGTSTAPKPPLPVAVWLPITTLALSVAGLAVSAYLTATHYSTSVTLACPESATINCEKVTSSAQSEVFGIPVAVLGLAFFVVMIGVNLPGAWRTRRREVHWLRLTSVVVGIGFVFYLVYAELFVIDAICLWCTAVHALTLLLFAVVAIGTATRPVEA